MFIKFDFHCKKFNFYFYKNSSLVLDDLTDYLVMLTTLVNESDARPPPSS